MKILLIVCILRSTAYVNGVNDIQFATQPQNITVPEGEQDFIACKILNTDAAPRWEIVYANKSVLTLPSSSLPQKHLFNGTGILLLNVDSSLNRTAYSCYLTLVLEGKRNFMLLKSTVGIVTVTERKGIILSYPKIIVVCKQVTIFLDS